MRGGRRGEVQSTRATPTTFPRPPLREPLEPAFVFPPPPSRPNGEEEGRSTLLQTSKQGINSCAR
eukprot:2602786-Prorocentrum_lima.AAC.1